MPQFEQDGGSRRAASAPATDVALTSRVQTWTASGVGTETNTITVPANSTLATAGTTATVTAATTSATEVAKGASAAAFMTAIAAWMNTGSNLAAAGLISFVDNLNGTATATYIAGTAANSIVPATTEPNLTFGANTVTGTNAVSGNYYTSMTKEVPSGQTFEVPAGVTFEVG